MSGPFAGDGLPSQGAEQDQEPDAGLQVGSTPWVLLESIGFIGNVSPADILMSIVSIGSCDVRCPVDSISDQRPCLRLNLLAGMGAVTETRWGCENAPSSAARNPL